ncbi:hypothetical protein GBAR_LOCUS23005 [Geodia barretti]|uniref:Uncharacterized protein n=1 Tax=Geodia barretti TaxID=519541 RepID=A0AA35T500_GEOBA|nr:hypothetical protein GBAR_LOCUS23005 [Geodia barretti]
MMLKLKVQMESPHTHTGGDVLSGITMRTDIEKYGKLIDEYSEFLLSKETRRVMF